jgi:hypothetical protein
MDSGRESSKFFDNFLFPKIFQAFRMAIQPSKLIIAFAALAIICLAGWIMDFSKTVVAAPKTKGKVTELQIYITSPFELKPYIERYKDSGERKGVFSTLWCFGSAKFHGVLKSLFAGDVPGAVNNVTEGFQSLIWAFKYHCIYSILFFGITLVVISVAGGGLCRIAALQFARDEKPGIIESLRFSKERFLSFLAVPLLPAGVIILIGLFIFLLGLAGNIPRVGELLIGIFMLPGSIGGALIAIILIGTFVGLHIMFPAIAYDGSDCFDAIGRCFSYVFSRPWRMCFYMATATVYGAVCYTFVRFFAFLLLRVTYEFLRLGVMVDSSNKQVNKLTAIWRGPGFMSLHSTPIPTTTNWSESFAAFLIYLALLVVVGLLVSFVISFYFSTGTIIYALMRKKVDNTATEDIYTPAAEVKTGMRAGNTA